MDQQELKNIIDLHHKWVVGDVGGTRANLTRADLAGANLADASLAGADLTGADLTRADLAGADLADASLADANLTRASLTRANLTRADLAGANLDPIRDDFFKVLNVAKAEVLGLYDALHRGKINGSVYEGECACLVGTIAKLRGEEYNQLSINLRPQFERAAERWFLAIKTGDIPQNNPVSAITAQWCKEFMDREKIQYPQYHIRAEWPPQAEQGQQQR